MGSRQVLKLWKMVDRLCKKTAAGKADYRQLKEDLEKVAGIRCV